MSRNLHFLSRPAWNQSGGASTFAPPQRGYGGQVTPDGKRRAVRSRSWCQAEFASSNKGGTSLIRLRTLAAPEKAAPRVSSDGITQQSSAAARAAISPRGASSIARHLPAGNPVRMPPAWPENTNARYRRARRRCPRVSLRSGECLSLS